MVWGGGETLTLTWAVGEAVGTGAKERTRKRNPDMKRNQNQSSELLEPDLERKGLGVQVLKHQKLKGSGGWVEKSKGNSRPKNQAGSNRMGNACLGVLGQQAKIMSDKSPGQDLVRSS